MVATVVELASATAALSYYERDGYYAKDDPEHRQASFWHGAAADAIGLRGHVHPKRFDDVLSGVVPGTDIRLGRMREGEREHRPGWDVTFSAPKSVSLEALIAGDRRVIRAHDDAVRATLDWIEAELLETRGWDPVTRRRPRVKADGMAVAGFRHLSSRDLDPQLHTHCVLANMTRTRDGAWRSVEPTRIRRSRNLIGAFYRNELARRLQAMGMATVPTMVGNVPGFELAGYDRSFLMAFSGRRREILAHLERLGLPYTPSLAQMAALHTRRRKRDRGLAELVPEWRERARALGHGRDRMALAPPRPVDPDTGAISEAVAVPPPDLPDNVIRNRKQAPALPELPRGARAPRKGRRTGRSSAPERLSREPETGPLEAVARAVAHAEERRTVIPETEIRAVALGHAPGRWTLDGIDAAVARLVREGELVETVRRGADRAFVTDRAVKAERQLLALMREGRGRAAPLAVEASVAARLEGGRLTKGQRAAVRTLLLAQDSVVGVQGHAGSGKTAMLCEAASLAGERRILGLAPSASAARVLAREAGVEAWTLQRFLVRHGDLSDPDRLARGREEFRGALLAVDEASMVDTARMEALLRISRTLGVARVALVGDTAQLRAVDAGQPFRLLQRAGMETAVMDEVLRQRDPALLEAVRRSREGAPGEATEILGERVREVPRGDLGAEAGRRWLALGPHERTDTAIMAPTHAIRREANAAVREGLAAEGALHGPSLVIDRLVDRRLTRAQAADIRSWEEGDTVVFHRDAYGCRQDDVCIVTAVGDGKVALATPGGERRFRPSGNSAWWCRLHDTEEIEIRAGDRIRWTRNRKAARGRPGLVNGGEAVVAEIGNSRVRFRDMEGRGFSLSRKDVQLRHLDHAYCTTVHAAQGATARSAIAVLESAGAVDQALFHVELSRASEEFLLLTDDREGLVEALEGRPGQDGGALEALGIDPERSPVVDPETFAALVADWRELERRGEEAGRDPFGLPGHEEVMARAVALSAIEDLPPDMRRTLDAMLVGHGRRMAEERKLQDLAARVRAHWRRWPELGWAARAAGRFPDDMPGHAAWRREGAALLDEARAMQDGPRRHERPDRESAPGEAGIRTEAAALERTRTLDDSGRFRRGWRALQDRARRDSVPEIHCAGWEGTARLGERLDGAAGLDAGTARAVAGWRDVRDRQEALVGEVRALPARTDAWAGRRARDLPLDPHGRADPAGPACRAWREAGLETEREVRAMLADDSPYRSHLDVMPDEAERVRRSLVATGEALASDRRAGFAWLADEVNRHARSTGVPPFHAPRFDELVALAGEIARDPARPESLGKTVRAWLNHRTAGETLIREIRDWPERAEAEAARFPGPDGDPEALAAWRADAEGAAEEGRKMLSDRGPHAAHLKAMPGERDGLTKAADGLDRLVAESMRQELRRHADAAERHAARTGTVAVDAPAWGVLMERVREFDAKGSLPDGVRRDAAWYRGRDERWGRSLVFGDARPAGDGSVPEYDAEDRRLADDALVLACAVSERVDAASPVHRDTLREDVEAVLRLSAEAPDVPWDEDGGTDEAGFAIARRRVEAEFRVEAARRIDAGEIFEARARFEGDPDFYRKGQADRYNAALAEGMRCLEGVEAAPSRIESVAARAVVATRGTDGHGLASAIAEALERGTVPSAEGLRTEREAVLAELQRDAPEGESSTGRSVREQRLLRRVCASFIGAEVRQMCEGKGPVMERLPGGAARERARATLRALHRETVSWDPSPWRRRQEMLGLELGLARDQGAEHVSGIYPEIEPW